MSMFAPKRRVTFDHLDSTPVRDETPLSTRPPSPVLHHERDIEKATPEQSSAVEPNGTGLKMAFKDDVVTCVSSLKDGGFSIPVLNCSQLGWQR